MRRRVATTRGAPRRCASARRRGSWRRARVIHSSSCQSWRRPEGTTLASLGGSSVWRAIGSALRNVRPSAVTISNLYRWPVRAAGASPDQIPVGPLASIIVSGSGDQSFQSPTTDTSDAFGAHTANRTPWASPCASITRPCGPSSSHSRRWVPSPKRWRSSSPIGRATVDIASTVGVPAAERGGRGHEAPHSPIRRAGRPAGPAGAVGCARRACAHAVVGLPATGDGRHRGPRRRADHGARPGRPRRRRAHDRRADDRHGGRRAPPTAGGSSGSCGPPSTFRGSRRSTRSRGRRRPTMRSPSSARNSPTCSTRPRRDVSARHRPRSRLADRLGRRHARHDPPGAVRARRCTAPNGCATAVSSRSAIPTDINSIEWWLAFQADRLIAPTRFMVEQLITGFELDADHVAHIPNGVDPALWRSARTPPSTEREPLVVSWGNVQYEKGFQVLARSMQHRPRHRAERPRRDRRTRAATCPSSSRRSTSRA